MSENDKEKIKDFGKAIHDSMVYVIVMLISIIGYFISGELNDIKEDRKASWVMINKQTQDIASTRQDLASFKQSLQDHIDNDKAAQQTREVNKYLNDK